MSDYSQGKIYMITTNKIYEVYIGSTIQTLEERLSSHKSDYKRWLKGEERYCTSFEILQYDDCEILLVEDYPCETEKELRLKEGEYICEMDCVNKVIPGRSRKEYCKEYYQKNKEYHKEYYKEYYKEYKQRQEVKEKLKIYSKEYYQKNKEKKKQYTIDNKEKLKAYHKEYFSNPEVIEKRNQKIICICSGTYSKKNKAKHYKTRKHIQYIEEMKEKGDPTNINECIEQITSTS